MKALVEAVYGALGRGDADTLKRILHPEFVATVSAGMPAGVGGVHRGADAMIYECWWQIGRSFAVLPEPEEFIDCADGRLLVCGTYRGKARRDGHTVEAAFTHLWTGDGTHLTALTQVTDTARW
jgi:ketosteroid isomerase-like protein